MASNQDQPHVEQSDHSSTVQRTRLIVLFGGQSAEHDVSTTTAAHVLAAVDQARYEVIPIGISRDGQWQLAAAPAAAIERGSSEFGDSLSTEGDPVDQSSILSTRTDDATTANTVVLPLLHGPLGEDGTVQGLLELANVAYVGAGVLASAVAMDKGVAKTLLSAAGVPQCAHRTVHETEMDDSTRDELFAALESDFGFPMFVKPANMGSSVGVSKVNDADELSRAVDLALSYDEWVIVEEAVNGREIELAVIGNLDPFVSVPGEVIPGDEFYSYDDKYLNGVSGEAIPADLTDAEIDTVQRLALDAYAALRCEGLARCDFFFEADGRGFLCNEINTMPGFTPISMFPKLLMASGWTYPGIIDRLVELAIDRHGRRKRNTQR